MSAVHLCSSGLPASPLQSSLSFTSTVRTIRTFAVLHSCTALSSDTANSGIQTSTTQFLVFFCSAFPFASVFLCSRSRFSLFPVFAVLFSLPRLQICCGRPTTQYTQQLPVVAHNKTNKMEPPVLKGGIHSFQVTSSNGKGFPPNSSTVALNFRRKKRYFRRYKHH